MGRPEYGRVASGILPDVESGFPARRKNRSPIKPFEMLRAVLNFGRLFRAAGCRPQRQARRHGVRTWVTVEDKARLVKVTNAVNHHWQRNNAGRKNPLAMELTNRHCSGDNMVMAKSGQAALNP